MLHLVPQQKLMSYLASLFCFLCSVVAPRCGAALVHYPLPHFVAAPLIFLVSVDVCVDHLITCKLIGLCRVNVLSIWHLFTYELKAKLHKQLNNNKYVVSSSVIRMLFMQPKRYKCILCIQQQQPAAISVVFVSQCSLHSAYSAC